MNTNWVRQYKIILNLDWSSKIYVTKTDFNIIRNMKDNLHSLFLTLFTTVQINQLVYKCQICPGMKIPKPQLVLRT